MVTAIKFYSLDQPSFSLENIKPSIFWHLSSQKVKIVYYLLSWSKSTITTPLIYNQRIRMCWDRKNTMDKYIEQHVGTTVNN